MATNGEEPVADRRRSGRTIRKPEIFGDEEPAPSSVRKSTAKRKRPAPANGTMDGPESDDDVEESEGEEAQDEDSAADEEEVKEQRKTRRKQAASAKPAAKRPKTANGTSTTLAIRPANGLPKTNSKATKTQKARSRPSQMHANGLYAEVFGHGNSAEEAASEWHESMLKDNVAGIRDLVNFILESIGCEARIDSSDIEDIDNVPSKLGDVLDEYGQQNSTDYPLASKLKQHAGFKEVLTEFFDAVIHALHNSGALYDEPAVYDNIHIWTATMSGAGYRPFRHTATVISLTMSTALCQIAQELQSSMATTKTQMEAEKKKKNTNKSRVAKLQDEMKREEGRLNHIDELLRDAFDTVYVHRYRDVDEKIRVECVTALGNWIVLYRKMFLEGQFLRYLGWVLSDPNAPTRLEVLRALKALFKGRGNVAALRAFIDRFRSRIVEMGSRDTDTAVRAEAIELLDRLRNAELLEPDDIDTVGQLIFDNEPRVRRAVSKFFVSNIEDLYKAQIEDIDQEQLASTLESVGDIDDFMDPCQSWIRFKCLAQTLTAHDQEAESRNGERNQDIYGTEDVETRYMLATQSIFPYMPDLQHWESLAGYLLFDHSSISSSSRRSDVNRMVQLAYKLENGEDAVLLDVLQCSVKLYLQDLLDFQTEKKAKRTKAGKDDAQKKQESVAHHLTLIIPQLLNKFGGIPEAAASILRLEQLLNIDLINDLQSGEASYTSILESINKQFSSHNDRKVLAEASKSLRAARSFEVSQEAVDTKVAEIWTDSIDALNVLLQKQNLSARGTINRSTLGEMGNILDRLAQLAAVSDCAEFLESRMSGRKAKNSPANQSTLLQTLMLLMQRGVTNDETTDQFNVLEDHVTGSVLTLISFYFRWRVVGLKKAITNRDFKQISLVTLADLAMQRSNFVEAVLPVITSRPALDNVRVTSILTLLDLYTLFATVRHMRPSKGDLSDALVSNLSSLSVNIPVQAVSLIMETHEKMEKRLARKTKKRIELPLEDRKKKEKTKRRSGATGTDDEPQDDDDDVEKPPEDSEDEADASDASEDGDASNEDEHESGAKGREARRQAALVAEQGLCELTSKVVLAVIATIINHDGKIKARLQVNRSRLGKSYGQIIAYLDEKKSKSKASSKAAVPVTEGPATPRPGQNTSTAPAAASTAAKSRATSAKEANRKSEPLVIEDDDIEDDDMEGNDNDDDAEDLRRRGLADDDDDDDDIEDDEAQGADEDGQQQADADADEDDEDEVMGD